MAANDSQFSMCLQCSELSPLPRSAVSLVEPELGSLRTAVLSCIHTVKLERLKIWRQIPETH